MTKKTMAQALASYGAEADLRNARIRLGLALPEDGWLGDYLKAVTPLTDAPAEFHLVSGLAALSAAAGTRLYTREWGQNVFPHLWAVLVAPSSFWRKSTAINAAEGLLRSAVSTRLYPSEWSRERFLSLLAERPAGLLTVKEFGGFLSLLGRDYNAGSKEMLTDLYDGPDVYTRALQKKEFEIKRPALTILGATTLDWLEEKITDGDLRGGFLARFLFVTAKEKASPKGLTGDMDATLRIRLIESLHGIADRPERLTPIDISQEARERYDEWMLGWEGEVMKTSHRSDLSGFAVRLQTYALKLSMLYRVSATAYEDEPLDHVIGLDDVERAIAYVRVLWASVAALVDERLAITKDAKELRRVLEIVGSGTTKSQALKLSKLKARDFDQYLDTLVRSGDLYQVTARASELGLDRQRDTKITWLSPHPVSVNGHVDADSGSPDFTAVPSTGVRSRSQEFQGEPQGGGSYKESERTAATESLSESPSSSTSLSSLHEHESSGARTKDVRARKREPQAGPDDDGEVLL